MGACFCLRTFRILLNFKHRQNPLVPRSDHWYRVEDEMRCSPLSSSDLGPQGRPKRDTALRSGGGAGGRGWRPRGGGSPCCWGRKQTSARQPGVTVTPTDQSVAIPLPGDRGDSRKPGLDNIFVGLGRPILHVQNTCGTGSFSHLSPAGFEPLPDRGLENAGQIFHPKKVSHMIHPFGTPC